MSSPRMRTGRSSPPYPSLPPSKSRSGIRALPASPSVRSSSLPGSLPSVSTTATRPSPILLRRVRPRCPTMVRFPFPSSYPELPIPCHLPGRKPNPVRREKTVQMPPCSAGSRSGTRARHLSTTIRSLPRNCSPVSRTATILFPVLPSVHSRFPSRQLPERLL